MLAPDCHDHSPDANCDRIASERPEVEWFDRHTLVKAEMPKAIRLRLIERIPRNRKDARLGPDQELVEAGGRNWKKRRVHSCD
jgi:hypothetical protein